MVEVPSHGQWAALVAWGPHAVADGPSVVAPVGTEHFIPRADVEPLEYAVRGVRYTSTPELVVNRPGWLRRATPGVRQVPGQLRATPHPTSAAGGGDSLELTFLDELRSLRVVLHYRMPAELDVVERWVSVFNDGSDELRLHQHDSAGFVVPTANGASVQVSLG